GRRTAERVAQLLIAVAAQFWPDAQRALEGADPGAELDTPGGEEAALELAVVRDVIIGAAKTVDDLREGRRARNVFIDDVGYGGRARRNGHARTHQGMHGIGDAAAAHHVDAGNLDDRVRGRIDAGGFDVDDAKQVNLPQRRPILARPKTRRS